MQIQVNTRHNKKYEWQVAAADAENKLIIFLSGLVMVFFFFNAASLNPSIIKF